MSNYGSTLSEKKAAEASIQTSQPQSSRRERLWSVLVSSVVSSLPSVLAGCTLGFPSGTILDLDEHEERLDFQFDTVLKDVFGALGPIGALIGGPIAGWIADYAGRKPALVLVGIPYLLGYLMMAYAHFIPSAVWFKSVMMIGRFLTGVGLGWTCIASPVYIAEISSNKLRGVFSTLFELLMCIGVLLIYSIASSEGFFYYYQALVMAGIVALFEICMVLLHETPRWLLANHEKDKAINALKFFRGPRYEIRGELDEIEADIEDNPSLSFVQSVLELGKREVLIPLVIVCVVMIFQEIGGVNASDTYSAPIFKEAHVPDYRAASAYAVGLVNVVFTLISAVLVDRIGRKVLLIVSGIGLVISTATFGAFFYVTRPELCSNSTIKDANEPSDTVCNSNLTPIAIASLILFNAAFSIGWGPVPWVLLGELIPLRVRGLGSGIATFVNWAAAAVVVGAYLDFAKLVNVWFVWWTFAFFNLLGVVFVALCVFETKGKRLEDIQHRFSSNKTRKKNIANS